MNLLEALVNAFRLPELRNKLLFTGGILVAFRLFANVAIPGASQSALTQLFNSQALLGLLDLFSGGGLSRFSIVAMGMNPYINATIIMQLMTVISERIKEIQKEGESGLRLHDPLSEHEPRHPAAARLVPAPADRGGSHRRHDHADVVRRADHRVRH